MSDYIGRKVCMRDSHGEWWSAFCIDVAEDDGHMKYILRLDNGDILKIPVDDISAILEKQKKLVRGPKVIQFPKNRIKRRSKAKKRA